MTRLLDLQTRFRDQFASSTAYAHRDACGESSLYSHLLSRPYASHAGGRLQARLALSARRALGHSAGRMAQEAAGGEAVLKPFLGLVPYATRLRNDVFAQLTYEQVDGMLRQRLETYLDLSEKFPTHMAAHFNLARIRFEKGRHHEAQLDFERMLQDESLYTRPNDLLFWREFHDSYFDYDLMLGEIVGYARARRPCHLRLIERAIRESCRLYLARIFARPGNWKRLVKCWPQRRKRAGNFQRSAWTCPNRIATQAFRRGRRAVSRCRQPGPRAVHPNLQRRTAGTARKWLRGLRPDGPGPIPQASCKGR